MSDKEQKEQEKPTEPKTIQVPNIEVTEEEGATGETEDNDDGKKSFFGTAKDLLGKGFSRITAKRSKSKSPETREDKTQMGAESSKGDFKSTTPPSKKGSAAFVRSIFSLSPKLGQRGEETENLCEHQVVPHADKHLIPPPPEDQGIASPSPLTESLDDKCDTYDRSSSISSAPSGYSTLPPDDCDTDITSPDEPDSPDEGDRQ